MLLELRNIKKYFKVRRHWMAPSTVVKAVDDVSLSVVEGENLSIIGESGSGKTTLARIMMKLMPQDAGEVVLNGRSADGLQGTDRMAFRKDIQMVFQDPYSSLDPRFSIHRIIEEGFHCERHLSRIQKDERIRELLGLVGLPGNVINRFPHEFSGGERQRIAIARALATHPKLLILDEAVSSLDVLVQAQILELLNDIQKRLPITYIFISHNLKVVKTISAKIAVMYQGKVVEMGPTATVLARPLHPYTQALLKAAIEYKAAPSVAFRSEAGAGLVEQGGGHLVMPFTV